MHAATSKHGHASAGLPIGRTSVILIWCKRHTMIFLANIFINVTINSRLLLSERKKNNAIAHNAVKLQLYFGIELSDLLKLFRYMFFTLL